MKKKYTGYGVLILIVMEDALRGSFDVTEKEYKLS